MKESGQPVVARRSRARSTRRPMMYWCGAAPVATLNRRAKWYGLRCATRATASSARSSVACGSMMGRRRGKVGEVVEDRLRPESRGEVLVHDHLDDVGGNILGQPLAV